MQEGQGEGMEGGPVLMLRGHTLRHLVPKGAAIRKAKAAHFEQAMADAARERRGIWPLTKLAK
jgi:hypothetical protein